MSEFRGTARFEIVRRLGAGAFGVVYEAHDLERDTHVALKTLTQLDAREVYRFKREFRALADVTHDNLVPLYELVSDGDDWFFLMGLVHGTDWLSYVRGSDAPVVADGPTMRSPVERSSETMRAASVAEVDLVRLRHTLPQLAAGVAALHRASLLHRDLKPSNVLVEADGKVVVVDFGIATELDPTKSQRTEEQVAGTPAYMAPEQAMTGTLTPAADWYALGVMIFEALTGRVPYVGAALKVLMDKQRFEPPRVRELVRDAPPDLDALCADLLRTDPAARPSGAEILRRLGAAPAPPETSRRSSAHKGTVSAAFVGRTEILAALRGAFDDAKNGRPATVEIHATSGMGKSTLVRAFLEDVGDDALVLAGRCYERESVPYKAFDSAIDALSRALLRMPREEAARITPRDAAALARVFPVLDRVPSVADAPKRALDAPDPQQLRKRAFSALRELLSRLCDRRPVILFIDDVQWGDADSAAILGELTMPPDAPAMLVLLAYRTNDASASPFLQALRRAPMPGETPREVRTLELPPLSPSESQQLASSFLGGPGPADILAKTIAEEAGGNPFFVAELAQYIGADLGRSGGHVSLDQLVQLRVRDLPDEARRMLDVVCVGVKPFRREVARRASGLGSDEAAKAIAALRVGRFVRLTGVGSDERIEPYHDRIREAVAGAVEPDALVRLHREIASALTEAGDDDPEERFLHFRAAGMNERAAKSAAAAARKAEHALSFLRAAELYRESLSLDPDAGPERQSLRLSLANALANAGRGQQAAVEYKALAEGARGADRVALFRRAAEELLFAGRVDEGVDALEDVLAGSGLRIAASYWAALFEIILLTLLLAVRGLRFTARDASGVPPDQLAKVDLCMAVGLGLGLVDRLSAAPFSKRQLLLCLSIGEPWRLSRALTMDVANRMVSGSRGTAGRRRILGMSRRLAEGVGRPDALALVTSMEGLERAFAGHWLEAHDRIQDGLRQYQQIPSPIGAGALVGEAFGSRYEVAVSRNFLVMSLAFLGKFEEAGRLLFGYQRDARERGDLWQDVLLSVSEGAVVWLVRDEPLVSIETAAAALQTWTHRKYTIQHYQAMRSRSEVHLYNGNPRGALEEIDTDLPKFRRALLTRVQIARVRVAGLRARAHVMLAASGDRSHVGLARREAKKLRSEHALWADCQAELVSATCHAIEGDHQRAITGLRSALSLFESAHMAAYAAATRMRLGEVIGGDEGRRLTDEGTAWMTAAGVKRPDRFAAMLAPGFTASHPS